MIKKSLFKKYIKEEITEILSNPPSYSFPKSKRSLLDNQDKNEVLKNEFIIISREINKLQKQLENGEGDKEQIQFHLDKNISMRSEIEKQIK